MNDWKDVDSYLEAMYPTMDEFNKVTIYGRKYGATEIQAWVNTDKSVTAGGTTYPQIKDAYGKTGYSFENVLYYSVDDLMDAIAKKQLVLQLSPIPITISMSLKQMQSMRLVLFLYMRNTKGLLKNRIPKKNC